MVLCCYSVSTGCVTAFLEAVFGGRDEPSEEGEEQQRHVSILSVESLSAAVDLKGEVMETLLTYLEVSFFDF